MYSACMYVCIVVAYDDTRSGPGSNGKEGVLHIPQNFKIEASPSGRIIIRTLILGSGCYPSTEMQCVYSTDPAKWIWLWVSRVQNLDDADCTTLYASLSEKPEFIFSLPTLGK